MSNFRQGRARPARLKKEITKMGKPRQRHGKSKNKRKKARSWEDAIDQLRRQIAPPRRRRDTPGQVTFC
jgi:hypothetical protein